MAVAVVDLLEVVEVEQDQRPVTAPGAVVRLGQQLLQAAVVGQAGQLVGQRLAVQRLVAGDVAGGDGGLLAQVGEQLELLGMNGTVAAERHDRGRLPGSADRRGERPRAGRPAATAGASCERGGLGRLEQRDQLGVLALGQARDDGGGAEDDARAAASASSASTAARATISTSASRSRLDANASPIRRTATCSRCRSRWSASSRCAAGDALGALARHVGEQRHERQQGQRRPGSSSVAATARIPSGVSAASTAHTWTSRSGRARRREPLARDAGRALGGEGGTSTGQARRSGRAPGRREHRGAERVDGVAAAHTRRSQVGAG